MGQTEQIRIMVAACGSASIPSDGRVRAFEVRIGQSHTSESQNFVSTVECIQYSLMVGIGRERKGSLSIYETYVAGYCAVDAGSGASS
jgi:hypothetical protein